MRTQNEILEQFREIAVSPKKMLQKYLSEGKKVAGCVAPYSPEEVIHSMGIVPMGIWGADLELKEAKKYYPPFICSLMQSAVELGIRGEYEGLSFVEIPSLCDAMQVTAENWRYAVPSIPVLYADYPHNRTKAGHDYIVSTYKRHISQIIELTGNTYSDEALAKSIEIYKEHAEVMLKFSSMAAECGISASDRNAVFKSSWFMLKEEHTALVKELMETMHTADDKFIRIITTGILADQKDLLKTMDSLGMRVVWDDVAHESRQYYVTYEGTDPLDVLADKFCNMKHCSLIYDREKTRLHLLIEECKEHKADALVMLETKFCDPEEFDYVFLKRECEKEGIPFVMIEVDRQMTNYDQAKTVLQTLKEMV